MTDTPKETWQDWQAPDAPEPRLLTRAELLAAIERLGISPPVDDRDLRYWETPPPKGPGVLPGPVRRHHHGATRALYPIWMVDLIASLRHFQQRGYALAELPGRMRAVARYRSQVEALFAINPAVEADDPARLQPTPYGAVIGGREGVEYVWRALDWLIRRYRDQDGVNLRYIAIELIDDHGRVYRHRVPAPPPPVADE